MNRLIFLLLCLGLLACGGNGAKRGGTADAGQTRRQETKDRVEILYFHGKQRCATCLAIEKHTEEAIAARFADELESGRVVFRTIDLSEAENGQIAEKYEVAWSALLVSKWEDGKETYENLTEYAFAHARTAPEAFKETVIRKIEKLLE